jgi:HSP20 family protein
MSPRPSERTQTPFYRTLPDIESFWCRDLGFNVTPAMDIVEKDGAFEVTAELPGLDAKNIDLQLSDRILTIKGEKQGRQGREDQGPLRLRASRRAFRRSLQIPGSADAEKIEANFKGGVLTISLPKSSEAQNKQKTILVSVK